MDSPRIAQVLDAYARGLHSEAIERLRPLGQARVLDKRLREEGPLWVAAGSPETREHRRQVAALVALEAAHLVFGDLGVMPFKGSRTDGAFLGREVLELGCEWLRQGASTNFEHLWMLASIAVVHGMQNSPSRAPSASSMPDIDHSNGRQIEAWYLAMRRMDNQHREHVAARFPNEPRVRLASVLARPEARRLSNRPGTTPFFISTGFAADATKGHPEWREREAAEHVRQVIDQLTALVDTPGIGAEARVRRGILYFHRAELAGALRDFRQASDTDDTVVAYMAHFYAGLTLDNLRERAEAINEFTAALKAVPNARSGALALAADLFLMDRREEAASRVESTLTVPAPNDPWRTFSLGDYRFWPGYVARLREAVRR